MGLFSAFHTANSPIHSINQKRLKGKQIYDFLQKTHKFYGRLSEILQSFTVWLSDRRKKRGAVLQQLPSWTLPLFLFGSGCLGFLAAFYAGTFIVLSPAEFGKYSGFGAAAFKTLQCAVQRLVVFDFDFRHRFPSLRHLTKPKDRILVKFTPMRICSGVYSWGHVRLGRLALKMFSLYYIFFARECQEIKNGKFTPRCLMPILTSNLVAATYDDNIIDEANDVRFLKNFADIHVHSRLPRYT